ncbi:leucine-rich repeat-containing protein 17 [Polypterus senegalus]
MKTIMIIMLLVFCRSAEFRKGKNGGMKNRLNGMRAGRRSTSKRFAAIDCKDYIELKEKYFDCQDKRLTRVSPHWPEDIIHMLLARNRIRRLENDMFLTFKNMKSLDLQQNDIAIIEEHAFAGLDKLTTLLLQHNRLQVVAEEVFINLPLLKYLRIYENPWNCTCELDGLIRKLQLPGSRNLGNYAKCAEPINLKDQRLKKIKADLLCEDDESPLQGTKKPLTPSSNIKEVDSTMCHIYMFPKPLLDCQNKDLKKVPADIPPEVFRIDLSRNKIKHLKAKEFLGLKDLKVLNLSSNAIQHIDMAAFTGLLHLRELDLSKNLLQHIDYGVLENLYFVQRLWLGVNPWRCDYNIHYLLYWLKHHYSVEHDGLTCKEPEEFKGWIVEEYVKSYYEECPKDKPTGQTDGIQEVNSNAEDQENMEQMPQHLIGPKVQETFKIIRLT